VSAALRTERKKQRWRFLVTTPVAYDRPTRPRHSFESCWGRTWTFEPNDNKRPVVDVEASPAVLGAHLGCSLPPSAWRAIHTEGRSAIEPHLTDAKLAPLIHVTPAGVQWCL
jgi:hypothetical protein